MVNETDIFETSELIAQFASSKNNTGKKIEFVREEGKSGDARSVFESRCGISEIEVVENEMIIDGNNWVS